MTLFSLHRLENLAMASLTGRDSVRETAPIYFGIFTSGSSADGSSILMLVGQVSSG